LRFRHSPGRGIIFCGSIWRNQHVTLHAFVSRGSQNHSLTVASLPISPSRSHTGIASASLAKAVREKPHCYESLPVTVCCLVSDRQTLDYRSKRCREIDVIAFVGRSPDTKPGGGCTFHRMVNQRIISHWF